MTDKRVPTPKKACPFTFQLERPQPLPAGVVQTPEEAARRERSPRIVSAAPCIGAQCQQWLHDEAGPEYGNCALAIAGIFTAEAASKSETLFELARQSEEQAQKAAALGNAALAQFRTVLEGSLAKLVETVQHLSEIVEDGGDEAEEEEPTDRAHQGRG